MIRTTYAEGKYLIIEGIRHGPFSSHWAACAAMIRLSVPAFKSLGGDSAADLAIEANIARAA